MSEQPTWTVIGLWDENDPIACGVILGEHETIVTKWGWSLCVKAAHAGIAMAAASSQMTEEGYVK